VLSRIRNNLGLKTLSLVIAVVAWGYLRLTPNPVIATARFAQQISVPLVTTGLGDDEIARFTDKEAVVAVEVPRDGAAIKPDMVQAVLNLAGRAPGSYNVPVEVIAPKLDIKSLSPATETLTIERIDERQEPVGIHYTGSLRQNIVVAGSAVSPGMVTLRAPTSDLAAVAGIRVDVPLPAAPQAFDEMLRPVATDRHGLDLPGVSVAPNLIRVRIRFEATGTKAK
jgi:YbbR domain-containing protein